jgi:GNAT superfamily N-acetyltransferase
MQRPPTSEPIAARLRVATLEDVPRITALIADSVRGLSTSVYSTEQIDASLESVFGVDTQLVRDGTYYVIECADDLAAAGGWSARQTLFGGDQMKGGADPAIDAATAPARIRAFFVSPGWARRGLGRQLYASCEAAARTRGFTRFELLATLPGVPLYRALGFQEVEPMEVPMPGGLVLPCIRMERPI